MATGKTVREMTVRVMRGQAMVPPLGTSVPGTGEQRETMVPATMGLVMIGREMTTLLTPVRTTTVRGSRVLATTGTARTLRIRATAKIGRWRTTNRVRPPTATVCPGRQRPS